MTKISFICNKISSDIQHDKIDCINVLRISNHSAASINKKKDEPVKKITRDVEVNDLLN